MMLVHRLRTVPLLLLAPWMWACAGGDERPLTTEERERVTEVGQRVAGALASELLQRLTRAMDEGGPAHAVAFCSIEAMPLTRSVVEELEGELAPHLDVGRTSFRYRNPANAPDPLDAEALRHFQEALAERGSLPGEWVRRAGDEGFRYYRPLTVGAFCLQCHGPVEEMDPDVRSILRERYPDDLATGYAEGDFRGVIRVRVPAEVVHGGRGETR